jgi:uncharacterized PurR-regulated membrane protein YhhQ (DUF165 family)
MNNEKRRNIEGVIFLVLFCLTIPAANWMIGHVGTVCAGSGPCLVPVAPGVMAPSGVLMIGAALVLRDLVQRRLGIEYGIAAIIAGAAISAGLAPPSLVIASAAAFLLSEFADFAVYTPLARRRLVLAVVASSLVGLVVDSIVFLWFARSTFCSARSSASSDGAAGHTAVISAPPRRAARPEPRGTFRTGYR